LILTIQYLTKADFAMRQDWKTSEFSRATNHLVGDRVRTESVGEKSIVVVDLQDASVELAFAVFSATLRIGERAQAQSMRMLVNVSGAHFDKAAIAAGVELTRLNNSKLLRTAFIGVNGLLRIAVQSVAAVAHQELKVFEDKSEAMAFLLA
jgi:hypothetical protein